MKTIIGIVILNCMLATVHAEETLVWSEEFNYTSAPSNDVWSYDTGAGGWGNAELQNYTSDPANVRVDGSNLVITAVKSGNNFTSARIKTLDKLTFKYGMVEARIQVPDLANGLWPAFWTLGNNFGSGAGWPECGEIDIMEMGIGGAINDGVVNRRLGSHFHWDNNGSYANFGSTKDMPSDIDGTFVVYRMEWTPTEVKTYINDQWIVTMDTSSIPEFNQQHFFILNLAVGGTYTGIFDANDITAPFPAEYKIDYIRIFDNGHTVLGGSSIPLVPATPYSGTPMAIPGTIELEDYDNGGEGVAYHDTSAANEGGDYRTSEGVDIEACTDTGGGYDVGWTAAGEWMKYTVDVASTGDYTITSRVAAGGETGAFHIEINDVDVTGSISVPNTGGWQSWVDKTSNVTLTQGEQVVKLVIESEDININHITFVLDQAGNNPPVFTSNPVIKGNAVEDADYLGQTLSGDATDTDGDTLSYSLASGGPAWLNVATNGALSGTPSNTDVGLNSWTVQVSDGIAAPITATLEIMVNNVNDAPVFTTDPIILENTVANGTYSKTIAGSATDVDSGAVLSYSLIPGGPLWLNVTTNGALSGIPDDGDEGLNSWTVQVSDGMASATATLEIMVIVQTPGINLLANPGLESGTTDWNLNLSGGAASASTAYAHSGTDSLEIDSTGASAWTSPSASQSFSASEGDVFNFQGYMLNSVNSPITGNSFGLFKIEFKDSEGAKLVPASVSIGTLQSNTSYPGAESTPHLDSGSATDTWVFSETQAVAPAGTAQVDFFVLNVNEIGNIMYFDDIQAIRVGDPIVVLPFTLSSSIVNENIQINFPTQNGVNYEVAYKNNLTHTNWIAIETVAGDGNTNSVSYPTSVPARFYNVLIP